MSKDATATTSVHRKWLDELSLELRLNHASGTFIGDTLATVEEYLADSGQSPEEAFGAAREYAAQLIAEGNQPGKASVRREITWSATSLLAFLVLSAALTPWLKGTELLIGGWQLASMAVLAALVVALPLYIPFLLRHFWALVAVPLVGGTVGVLAALLTPKTADAALLALQPVPVLVLSAAALIALSVAGTILSLRKKPDPIVSPLADAPANTLKARWFEVLTQWLFPILAVVLLGFSAAIHALT